MNPRSQSTRRSLAARISLGVASRLSVVGQREPARSGTLSGVVFNTLCNVMGAGVLSLPLATYNASVVWSCVLLLLVAFLAAYAVYCLVTASSALERYSFTELAAFSCFPSRDFEVFCADKLEKGELGESLEEGVLASHFSASTAAAATTSSTHRVIGYEGTQPLFTPAARRRPFTALEIGALRHMHDVDELNRRRRRRLVTMLVEGIIFLSNFGSLVIYCKVVIEAIPAALHHLLRLHERSDASEAAWVAAVLSSQFWAAVSGVVFFLLSCIRDMEELKWTSLLGFLTIFYIVCCVSYRFVTAHGEPPNPDVPAVDYGQIRWYEVHTSLFRAMATYGLAFGYHVNVPYFYKELRQRNVVEMMRSVSLSFPVIILSYMATGVLGYLTFGDLVADPAAGGNIAANYARQDTIFLVGRLGLCLHFACVFPIVSICTRRGLHRLVMTLLTWGAQTETMLLAAGLVLQDDDDEAAESGAVSGNTSRGYGGAAGTHTDYAASSTTPLLPATQPYTQPLLVSSEETDRDVGSPDETTRLAIVAEALFIVSGAMALALLVPGISFVMDIVGTLFSLPLMLVVPSGIGVYVFSNAFANQRAHARQQANQPLWPSSSSASSRGLSRARSAGVLFDSAALAESEDAETSGAAPEERTSGQTTVFSLHRYGRLKQLLCYVSLCIGVVFTLVGTALLLLDHWK